MPTAGPFIAAITGLGMVRRRESIGMYSLRSTLPTSSGVRRPPSPTISVTSAPEQHGRREPVEAHAAHGVVPLNLFDRVAELLPCQRTDRVHLFRPVQLDQANAV